MKKVSGVTNYIPYCLACQEMTAHGLTFEETHNSYFPGFIQWEDEDGNEVLIPDPHCSNPKY